MPNLVVQSVLVPKEKYNREQAIKWVKGHFTFKKIDSFQRKNFYSFRQQEPVELNKKGYKSYVSKTLPNNVVLVLASKKPT